MDEGFWWANVVGRLRGSGPDSSKAPLPTHGLFSVCGKMMSVPARGRTHARIEWQNTSESRVRIDASSLRVLKVLVID